MKKHYLMIFVTALLVSYVLQAQPVKVGYFTEQKGMHGTATTVQNDPIIRMLKADPNFEVTVNATSRTDTADLSGYDVVIVQESYNSSAAILMPTGALGMGVIDKPFIINKTYTMRAGRGFVTGTPGSGAETEGVGYVYLKVDAANQSNDIFKGITFVGDSVAVFKTVANDAGLTVDPDRNKALNYAIDVVIKNAAGDTLKNTMIGRPAMINPAHNATVCINDLPATTVIGSETLKTRMIALGMNFGAICGAYGLNFTDEGLSIWRNAIYSLAGLPVPATLASAGKYKVGYFTYQKNMDPTATPVGDDPIIRQIKSASDVFDLTVNVTDGDSVLSLDGYELVIVQESYNSGDAILKHTGSLGLPKLTMPAIINKTFGWRNNRILRVSTAASLEGAQYLRVVNPTHPIFTGITPVGDSVKITKKLTDDLGAAGSKASNYTRGNVMSDTGLLAYPVNATADVTINLNDLPGGTIIDGDTTLARIITFGNNFGAMCASDGHNLTNEGITLWRNAIHIALGLGVPAEMVKLSPVPSDFNITFIVPGDQENVTINFLKKQGFNVTKFWMSRSINLVASDTIDMLDAADLLIIGRSGSSWEFNDSAERVIWNHLAPPMVVNCPFKARGSRLRYFNSENVKYDNAIANHNTYLHGETGMASDLSLQWITYEADSTFNWEIIPTDYIVTYTPINGEVLVSRDDSIPLVVRFAPNVEFYDGAGDSAAAERVYFGMGDNASSYPYSNMFPFGNNGQSVYMAEVCRLLGIDLIEPVYFNSDNYLQSLSVGEGTLVPAFDKDVLAYEVNYGTTAGVDSVEISGAAAVATSTVGSGSPLTWSPVGGTGMAKLPLDTIPILVSVTAENGTQRYYKITFIQIRTSVEEYTADGLMLYPNPVNDMLVIKSPEAITRVSVFNIQGSEVLSRVANNRTVELSLSNLKAGIYFVKVQSGNNVYVNKINKN